METYIPTNSVKEYEQEALFPLEVIDSEIRERELALIGVVRSLVENKRQQELSCLSFLFKSLGAGKSINKYYDAVQERINTVESTAHLISDGLSSPGFYNGLKEMIIPEHYLDEAQQLLADR